MPDGTVRFKDSEGKDIFHFMGYVAHVGINVAYWGIPHDLFCASSKISCQDFPNKQKYCSQSNYFIYLNFLGCDLKIYENFSLS
jgi:hypothetical protein